MAKISNQNLDSYKDAIDNYGDEIQTITDQVVVTRMRPGMYCGGVGNQGFLSLIREVYQNSLDQIENKESPANKIDCTYDENTYEFVCSDNGLGFPYDAMVRMVTAQHTSRNFVRRPGEFPAGMHGVGLKVTNFLSTECHIESYKYDGTAMRIDLEEGYLKKGPYTIPNKNKAQGSVVRFIPSTDVLGEITLEWKSVYRLIKNLIVQAPIGAEVTFMAIDSNGVQHTEHFVNSNGILTVLQEKVKMPIIKPIGIAFGNDDYRLRVAFAYDTGGEQGPDPEISMTAFCNMCPTIAGPHIDSTIDAICRWFSTYMNGVFLSNQKAKTKTKVTAADIKTGLNIMISAASGEPVFIGQAKEKLGDDAGMTEFCKNSINEGLNQWSKDNPNDLAKLAKYFKDIAEIRMKSEGEKVKLVTSYQQNVLTGLPAKYAKPTVEDRELLIVEGDSAGGSAKTGRDVRYQGIFPIRGKIISAFSNSRQRFWQNEEAQGIARILLNKDYYRNFDAEKDVKWQKIIFMADADVDGAHIATLLLRFFLLYMPQLIEAGKVYKALPPLYSFENGKQTFYITDQLDFIEYVKKCFIKSNTICNEKGEQLSSKELSLLFATNEDYVYELERLANTYAVDIKLMELALFERIKNVPYTKIEKELKDKFRFMTVNKTKSGDLLYQGTIKESNYLFMNDRLVADCQRVLSIIEKNKGLYYIMNGNKVTLYDVMKTFDKSTPNSIKRYKGLGVA